MNHIKISIHINVMIKKYSLIHDYEQFCKNHMK